MDPSAPVPVLEGLALDAVEWLPSGSDAGLVRVRGRWTDLNRREADLPALGLRRAGELRRFESLPDARFGRDPALWRATYLVPAALMEPRPEELWLGWESGARAVLPAPDRGFEPPATPAAPAAMPERGGEVVDRAVLAEHRARRAEAAERASAQRAAEALKAVEVLELRSAELERRLEALQSPPADVATLPVAEPVPPPEPAISPDAHTRALASVKRLREELDEQRRRARRAELLRAADEVALASQGDERARAQALSDELDAREQALGLAVAEAVAAREQAAEQVRLAGERAAADAAAVRARADEALGAERERTAAAEAAAGEARGALDVVGGELTLEREAHAAVRERLQTRDRELTAIAAELAGVRAELEDVRADAADRAADLDRRLAALDAALAGERAAHAGTSAGLEAARAELAAAHAVNQSEAVARAALDEELDRERLARIALAGAVAEAQREAAASEALRTELLRARDEAEAATAERLAAAEEAVGHAERTLAAELETMHEQELALRAELTAMHDRHRVAEATLQAQRDERAKVEAELLAAQEERATMEAGLREELHSARVEHATVAAGLRAELDAARERIAALEREVVSPLQARIAELERDADDDLERRAREQAAAAAAVAPPPDAARIAGQFDAAAAALRARVTPPAEDAAPGVWAPPSAAVTVAAPTAPTDTDSAPTASAPEPTAPAAIDADAAPTAPARELSPPSSADSAAAAAPVPEPVADLTPRPATDAPAPEAPPTPEPVAEAATDAAAEAAPDPPEPAVPAGVAIERPRPRIVTESRHPPRADAVGTSRRDYPWLRGALVKLAHDDPRAATRLLLALVPAQHALIEAPLEYDLTIREAGTYAVSVTPTGASARTIAGPRPRREAAFHVSADVVTLTEMLAGVHRRMGRWFGSVRVKGRKRGAEVVRDTLARTDLDLARAARAGADLDPDLVFRSFAYAIHPAWTKGHRFVVAQEIADPSPQRWHLVVRDGRPIAVEKRADGDPDAVVSMSRATFSCLLQGRSAPAGERPCVRGDRAAVELLRAWTERAQHHAG